MADRYDKDEDQQDLSRRRNLPVVGGVYRHYKGGLYVVLAVGIHEATGEPTVCYRSNARGTVWFRDLKVFQERIPDPDDHSRSVPRFLDLEG